MSRCPLSISPSMKSPFVLAMPRDARLWAVIGQPGMSDLPVGDYGNDKPRTPRSCARAPFHVNEWLLLRNECGGLATVGEHFAPAARGSCLRRFLATPLHEMIF